MADPHAIWSHWACYPVPMAGKTRRSGHLAGNKGVVVNGETSRQVRYISPNFYVTPNGTASFEGVRFAMLFGFQLRLFWCMVVCFLLGLSHVLIEMTDKTLCVIVIQAIPDTNLSDTANIDTFIDTFILGIIYGSAQAPDQSGRGTVTTSTGSRIVRNASSGVISGRMMMSSILDQTARESWALPYIIPFILIAAISPRNEKSTSRFFNERGIV